MPYSSVTVADAAASPRLDTETVIVAPRDCSSDAATVAAGSPTGSVVAVAGSVAKVFVPDTMRSRT